MRRIVKIAKWAGLLVGLFAFALIMGVVVPRPIAPIVNSASASVSETGKRSVLLLANPIHTDIAFPVDRDVLSAFGFLIDGGLDPGLTGAEWIVLGWGGRAFYTETPTWSELKPGPVFKALTVDASVMHVALAGAIDPDHPSVRNISLDEENFAALLDEAMTGFTRDGANEPIQIAGKEYGAFDRFYEGEGWFNVFVGCNIWTAGALRAGGVRTGVWTPLPFLLNASLDLHN